MKSSRFEESREYKFGDCAQRDWAQELARRGRLVLPVYGLDGNSPATKAPVILRRGGGWLVAPDLLVMGNNGKPAVWNEVKAKGIPTWRIYPPGPRWEHGFDFSLVSEYGVIEADSGMEVWIVVFEQASPLDANVRSPLEGPPVWLMIPLRRAIACGDRRSDWPGGKKSPRDRGRRGKGGLLWARTEMQIRDLKIACNQKTKDGGDNGE